MDWPLIVIGVLVVLLGWSAFFGAPYVPSRRRFIRKALKDLYPLTKKDVVVDIGSGDGVVMREVSQQGATAIGYEINLIFVVMSRLLNRGYARTSVRWNNIWNTPLPDETTLVYIFSVSRDSKRMAKKLKAEALRLNRPLNVMTYGSGLHGETPIKTLDAYQLYRLSPLQVNKP